MALNADTSTALVTQFKGSAQATDPYDLDLAHGLYSQNIDFIVGPDGTVQCGTRRGCSQVLQIPSGDGPVPSMDSWYFVLGGTENDWVVYYSPSQGVKALDQSGPSFTSVLMSVTGATVTVFQFDGTRLYAAFADSSGRVGFASGQVYGLSIGADPLFAAPLTTSVASPVVTQTGAGVVTAGTHRLGFTFTTRNGYTGALNPVTSGTVFAPVTFTAADGVHDATVTITWTSIPAYLLPGGTVHICMTSAANLNQYFLVPGATGSVPITPGTTAITFSISDNDLVEGTDVTLNQTFLTCAAGSGTPPIKPSALFTYSSRMAYVALDPAAIPAVFFSNQNAYQELTLAQHAIYLEGRQLPIQGASLGGLCYIATLSGLYSTQDNGDVPVTWTPPARVDGSVGILSASCMLTSGGKVLLASEKGFFVFRGGAFPQIPISYWQSPDWNRINWTNAYQIQIVDDTYDRTFRVLAPLKVVITGASNTNPIEITTAVLVNGKPIAYPHLFQSGLSVTITGVSGNTAANTTQVLTVTSANTFTIPVAGNGAYIPGAPGYSGQVSPNSPNAWMCWNYAMGDSPGELLYSLNAFASYRAGAMSTIRNIVTKEDETWFAPAASTGGIIRRALPTDSPLYRDIKLDGSSDAISCPYETTILPGSQDTLTTLHDFHGAHLRINGLGSLDLTVYALDHSSALVPLASPITLSQLPGSEILVKWFLRSEQSSLSVSTNAVDAYFVMALIRYYYTNSLMQR